MTRAGRCWGPLSNGVTAVGSVTHPSPRAPFVELVLICQTARPRFPVGYRPRSFGNRASRGAYACPTATTRERLDRGRTGFPPDAPRRVSKRLLSMGAVDEDVRYAVTTGACAIHAPTDCLPDGIGRLLRSTTASIRTWSRPRNGLCSGRSSERSPAVPIGARRPDVSLL